jgi:hypothetical protein
MRVHVAALVPALALAACAGAPAPAQAPPPAPYRAHGLAVTLPPGWQAARTSLTPNLADPREALTVATFPPRYRRTRCAHMPGSALADLGPRDALITLMERARPGRGFPPRPARFGPRLGGPSEASACVPHARFTDHWFTFSEHGRGFHVLVAFGPHAPASTRRQAWGILDGMAVDRARISVGRPDASGELIAPSLRTLPAFRLFARHDAHADPRDRCVATVAAGKPRTDADRWCSAGPGVFVSRPGIAGTVVGGIAAPGVVRIELDGHQLPLSPQRAFLAVLARGRPHLVATSATGERTRLTAGRVRRAGAVFDDEIGESILTRSRAEVIRRFGAPAATRAGCDYYQVVGDDRRRGWRFCYRAGGVMTGASAGQRLP